MRITKTKSRSNLSGVTAAATLLLAVRAACGQVFTVNTTAATGVGSLGFAITQANAYGNGATIDFQNNLGTINAGVLPSINVGMTINGGVGNIVSGQNANRIFFVNAPGQSVAIESLTLAGGLAQGGNGGSGGGGGGGGGGLGGALFINAGAVNLQSVSFTGNAAVGGAGAPSSTGGGGGGGGLDFGGGSGNTPVTFNGSYYLEGSGGGGSAHTSAGGNGNGFSAGSGGGINGVGPNLSAVAPDGGGGGGTLDTSGANLGGYVAPSGGNGGDFGGGGGGAGTIANSSGNGGNGGFGAGGGGGSDAPAGFAGNGGNGGFGGGGGGGAGTPNEIYYGPSIGGTSGFNGGNGGDGNEGGGGGGAALGGAIFVRSTNGASVSLTDTSTDAGTVTGGIGGGSGLNHNGAAGAASGSALFLMGGNTTFTVDAGKTETIAGTIAQSQTSSITLNGGGILILSANNGTAAGYTGGTTINGGELSVSADNNLGGSTGGIALNGGLLQVTGSSYQSTNRTITLGNNSGGFDIVNPANVFTVSKGISGSGGLTTIGFGTLALNDANTYTGITNVSNGTLELGFPYNGTAATLGPANTINVTAGAALTLGSASGQANVLGSGANAPNVSIPTINLAGGVLNTYPGTTSNLGQIYLTAGTINGSSSTLSIFYDYTLNSPITVNANTSSSFITAAGGVGLRIPIPFNVSAGTGSLVVTAALHDEPNQSGGVTKNSAGEMVLEGADTYSAGTVVNAGTLVLGGADALPLNSALTINGGTASFLNVNAGTKFLSELNTLSIAGSTNAWAGKLDLNNNDLIVHTGSLATLTNQLNEGYSNGTWNGSDGIVSSSAASSTNHLTALGIIQNNQSGIALFTGSHQFDGVTPDAGDLLLKYTYYGDANLDGKVDGSDYSLIDNGYLQKLTGWYNGDFNYDGVINGSDYTLIDNAFNTQGAQLSASIASPTAQLAVPSAVPEPTTATLLGVIALGILGRRCR